MNYICERLSTCPAPRHLDWRSAARRSLAGIVALGVLAACGSSPSSAPSASTPTGSQPGQVVVSGPIVSCVMIDGGVQVVFDGVDQAACNKYGQELAGGGAYWVIGHSYPAMDSYVTACVMSGGSVKSTVVADQAMTGSNDNANAVCSDLEQHGWTQDN